MTPVRALLLAALLVVPCLAHAQDLAPGESRLLSKSVMLVERGTGAAFVHFTSGEPAKFVLGGPGRFSFQVRVFAPTHPLTEAVDLLVLSEGKQLAEIPVPPNFGQARGDDPLLDGAVPVHFDLNALQGTHTYEIYVDARADRGAAVALASDVAAAAPVALSAPEAPRAAPARPAHVAEPRPEIQQSLGAGLEFAPNEAAGAQATPNLGYRVWFGPVIGLDVRAFAAERTNLVDVSTAPSGSPGTASRVAPGEGYDMGAQAQLLLRVSRHDDNGLYLFGGAGPSLHKEPRRLAESGVIGAAGVGLEFSPPSWPAVAFSLEGGLRASSYPSLAIGSSVQPVLAGRFQFYFGR